MNQDKKVVLITGGSSGIGFEIAIKYFENNWNVVILGRKKYNYFPKSSKFKFIKGNVVNENSHLITAKSAIKFFNRLDCYINCAGISEWKSIDNVNRKFWDKIINTNLLGTMWGCKTASNFLSKNGSIINISSIAGKRGSANNSVYCASKFGVNGITQSLSKELGKKKIRVNSVCPVYIKTKGLKNALKHKVSPTNGKKIDTYLEKFIRENSSLKSLPSSEDVANFCYFLSSDKAKSITGQCLNIDSGVFPQ